MSDCTPGGLSIGQRIRLELNEQVPIGRKDADVTKHAKRGNSSHFGPLMPIGASELDATRDI